MHTAALLSLATSVPPHTFLQKDVLAAAWDIFGSRFPDYDRFASIFHNTGIVKRHGVKPFDWYLQPRGWPERTEAFFEGAEALFVDVAGKALAGAGLMATDVDTVVTVCSTGIATPSLDARVARRMGFRSDISRVPVFGLGCAGGASGLSIASRLAQARPGTNVLLVTIELCSLALRLDELTKANIIATSLFGDGAAAIVLRAKSHIEEIRKERDALVFTEMPYQVNKSKLQERIAWLSMSTVQAPHWAMPQENFVPVSFKESRSTHSSGVSGSTSTVCMIPLTTSEIAISVPPSLRMRAARPPRQPRVVL